MKKRENQSTIEETSRIEKQEKNDSVSKRSVDENGKPRKRPGRRRGKG